MTPRDVTGGVDELERLLASRLAGELPGGSAQARLAPRPREGWQPDRVPADSRVGAGLLLIYPSGGRPHLLLTVRDGGMPLHAGQVSLPGGGVRRGEAIVEAALREAEEETGVRPQEVRILGELSPLHIPVSGFVLHPVVGVARVRPELRPQPGEVERILEVPLAELSSPERLHVETRAFRGRDYRVPWIDVDGEKLWGATAMIVAELLSLTDNPPPDWS